MRVTSEEVSIAKLGREVLRLYSFPNTNKFSVTIQAADGTFALLSIPKEESMVIVEKKMVVIPEVTVEQLEQLIIELQAVVQNASQDSE